MSLSTTVEVKGLEELQRKFDMSNKVVKREAHDAMESAVALVHQRAGTYPPAPPSSSYQRKGARGGLASGFDHRVEHFSGGVKGFVTNTIPYAGYVRGEGQAWMHVGRWATMKKIVQEKMGQIEGFFKKAMDNLAKFLGD